jgi:PiT family inorganic phosphate transporter
MEYGVKPPKKRNIREGHGMISFLDFVTQVMQNPALLVTVLLTLAVILVNGWTDAPNAIATAISTRAIAPKTAILVASVFNFLGILVMTTINKKVAETIYKMVDFGDNSHEALVALCAAMIAIVLWAVAAWVFGIPTSESHALIAGLTGAAISIHNSLEGVNGAEWMKVLYGLMLSTFLGFAMGYIFVKFLELLFRNVDRRKTTGFFRKAQVTGAAAMAFMHGAQDGQKFMGVFLLGMALSRGQANVTTFEIPFWLILLCSIVMGLGTSVGGYRIIKAVGMDMVKLETYQGFAADIAGAGCLLISSLTGVPVSTTHTKTTAIMGVGAARRLRSVNWSVVGEMLLTWVLTFPGCGLIGFIMAKLFLAFL